MVHREIGHFITHITRDRGKQMIVAWRMQGCSPGPNPHFSLIYLLIDCRGLSVCAGPCRVECTCRKTIQHRASYPCPF